MEQPIRLIQRKPAWNLHALLRYLKLPYLCENIDSQQALGLNLPVVVVEEFVLSEADALTYLLKRFSDAPDENIRSQLLVFGYGHPVLCQLVDCLRSPRVEASYNQVSVRMGLWSLGGFLEFPREFLMGIVDERAGELSHLDEDGIVSRLTEDLEIFVHGMNGENAPLRSLQSSYSPLLKAYLFGLLMDAMAIESFRKMILRRFPELQEFLFATQKELFCSMDFASFELSFCWNVATKVLLSNMYLRKCPEKDRFLYKVIRSSFDSNAEMDLLVGPPRPVIAENKAKLSRIRVDWFPQNALLRRFFGGPRVLGGELVEDGVGEVEEEEAENDNNEVSGNRGSIGAFSVYHPKTVVSLGSMVYCGLIAVSFAAYFVKLS